MKVRLYKVGNKYRAKIKTWYWPFWRWYRASFDGVTKLNTDYHIVNFKSTREARQHFTKTDSYTELLEEFNV